MDVIKRAYDLIRKRERLNEEKRSYETVVNARDGISGFLVGFKQITINFPDCIKYAIIIYYILQSGRNNEYTL